METHITGKWLFLSKNGDYAGSGEKSIVTLLLFSYIALYAYYLLFSAWFSSSICIHFHFLTED